MPKNHRVQQGDCLLQISTMEGFFVETLWNHGDNAKLKSLRHDPNCLAPGDVVVIPDREEKEVSKATEARHRFRRKGVPGILRLRLTRDGHARAGLDYTLEIDGVNRNGQTDRDGKLEESLPPTAKSGSLTVINEDGVEEIYPLDFGTVDPLETEAGQDHRLADLGYQIGEERADAISAFQRKEGLTETGEMNQETMDKLKEVFGQ